MLVQYVDDLLICSETEEQCEQDTVALLERLACGGHKVPMKKLQFCRAVAVIIGKQGVALLIEWDTFLEVLCRVLRTVDLQRN